MSQSLAHSPNNDHRRDDLVKEVRSLGAAAAAGGDSLPMLAHHVVRAAQEGIITTVKDTDGKDDAHKLYAEYAATQSKKAVHTHTDGGTKANVSKLRKLIEFGEMPIIDPVDVMNRTKAIRDELHDKEIKLRPVYASYVEVAREQLDNPGVALSDEQIKECVSKPEAAEKTLEKELSSIHKRLEKLVTGEGGLKDQSSEIIQAEEMLRSRLASMLTKSTDAFYAEFTAGANQAEAA